MHEHTDPYRMDDAVASAACAARGATTERSRAALMGVSVSTMRRWRDGGTPPRIDVIDAVCARLGVKRAALFPGLAGTVDEKARTQAELIAEAADKVAAGWPALTEDQQLELSRILSTAAIPALRKAKQRLGRAA